MIYTPLVKKAMLIAEEAHRGQFDKGGYPYIFHPYAVAEILSNTDRFKMVSSSSQEHLVCTALLHDVLEDAEDATFAFYAFGINQFPQIIINALHLLTREPGDTYETYINKITDFEDHQKSAETHRIACLVKQADLIHNLTESRLENEIPKDRKQRYQRAFFQILGALGFYGAHLDTYQMTISMDE